MSLIYKVYPDDLGMLKGILTKNYFSTGEELKINGKEKIVKYCVPVVIKYYPKSNVLHVCARNHIPLNTRKSLMFVHSLGFSSFDHFKASVFNEVNFCESYVEKVCFFSSFQEINLFSPYV